MILQFVLTDSIITLQSIPNRILILITLSGYEYEKSYPPWLMGGLWVWGLNRPITIRTNPYPLDPPHTSLLHFYKVLIYIDFVYFYRKLLTKIKDVNLIYGTHITQSWVYKIGHSRLKCVWIRIHVQILINLRQF